MNEDKTTKPRFITIINDCKEDNAKARQETRWSNLFPGTNISFVGVESSLGKNATLQAGGNLIDILDAGLGDLGIVALNVAPRGDKNEKNGSQFAYFYYKKTLVVSTIKDYNLSLVTKLGITKNIFLLDTEDVLNFAENNGLITTLIKLKLSKTQFRSYEFQPRVAKWIFNDLDIPKEDHKLETIPTVSDCIWHIDSFGNYKTTILEDQVNLELANKNGYLDTNLGQLPFYNRLKDVPERELAVYIGSSGIEHRRFLEIAKQNSEGSAHKQLNKYIGFQIEMYNK